MDLKEVGVGAVLLIVVGMTVWLTSAPTGTLNGKTTVKTVVKPHLIRHGDESDGTLVVTHKPSGDRFTVDLSDRLLYQDPEQANGDIWGSRLQRDRYLLDPGLDLGCFAGIPISQGRDDAEGSLRVGVRVSPARLLYGTVSPDALITQDAYGLGITAFPPPDRFGSEWNHVGLGVGRLWSMDGGDAETLIYVGFSTRF